MAARLLSPLPSLIALTTIGGLKTKILTHKKRITAAMDGYPQISSLLKTSA